MNRRSVVAVVVVAAAIFGVGVPSAQSVACEAEVEANVSLTGDQEAAVSERCAVAGGSHEAGVTAHYDRDEATILTTHHDAADRDGDGTPETVGHGGASVGCGPPEEWGLVTSFVCPVLTNL